ncbi:hypothetical protein IHE45_17G094700 [Dioscorea alata]|uniref:Uncharacterized protein n=1 Tax=Dioscorea alata TaxID=55571 RepID=A0ACB7UE28_DIOAL|nr:hypothetical protein IHE45_17G094700 [Dioscorea alata]
MARFSVDGAGKRSAKKRKKVSGSAEESPGSMSGVAKENQPTNHEATVKSEERVKSENEEGGQDESASNGNGAFVRIDTDALDCPICYEALFHPIYQCKNGHVVCSRCCVTTSHKCPVCPELIGIRCLALERVIESVKMQCVNAKYGCNATLAYSHREAHQKTCNYAACNCPDSSCSFQGSTGSLSQHVRTNHKKSAVEFRYGCHFPIAVNRLETPFLVLIGSDDRLFLLLNKNDTTGGNALSMICICSSAEDHNFVYELSVGDDTMNLKLKSSAEVTNEWKGVHPAKVFLFVPKDFFAFSHKIIVNVSIQKCKLPPTSADGNHT